MNGMYIGHKISHLFCQPLSYKYLDSGTPSGQVEMLRSGWLFLILTVLVVM